MVLLIVVAVTWFVGASLFGVLSLIGLGLFGLTLYTIPAIVGVYLVPGVGAAGVTSATTSLATSAYIIAWASVCLCLMVARRAISLKPPINATPRPNRILLQALFLISLAMYFVIASRDGVLFFLAPRQVIDTGGLDIKIIWRWVNAYGLIVAISLGRRGFATIFGTLVLVYFVAGDRTVIAVLGAAIFIQQYFGRAFLPVAIRPAIAIPSAVGLAAIVFGKSIYLSVKDWSLDPLLLTFSSGRFITNLAYFEPFVVHNQMEVVTARGFDYPLWEVVKGSLGQLLLIPSLFGIDSSSFNVMFTDEFYPGISYGLAFNYWAQGYAVGRELGIVGFAAIFVIALVSADVVARKVTGARRAFVLLVGALVAVYIHRNSLENILAIVRQLAIVGIAAAGIAVIFKRWLPTKGGRGGSHPS